MSAGSDLDGSTPLMSLGRTRDSLDPILLGSTLSLVERALTWLLLTVLVSPLVLIDLPLFRLS